MNFFYRQEFKKAEVLCEVGLARLAGLGCHVIRSISLREVLLTTNNDDKRGTSRRRRAANYKSSMGWIGLGWPFGLAVSDLWRSRVGT